MPIFQQGVDAELYVWLLKEQKRRKTRSIQEVVRQVLCEAKKEAEKYGYFCSFCFAESFEKVDEIQGFHVFRKPKRFTCYSLNISSGLDVARGKRNHGFEISKGRVRRKKTTGKTEKVQME